MEKIIVNCILLCVALIGYAQQPTYSQSIHTAEQLQEGDLLFYASATDNPITDVTNGFQGTLISHVSIVVKNQGKPYILEATHEGVIFQPIDRTFNRLNRRKEHIYVGRIHSKWDIKTSIDKAKRYIGKPYDFYFEPNDSAIYCSELVQLCYQDKQGHLLFEPIPMSFHDKTGKITNYWKEYYHKVGKEVPEGAPGSNPGDLSRNQKVKIIGMIL